MKSLVASFPLALVSVVQPPGVGDPESFGNTVIYLGRAESNRVSLEAKCPLSPPNPGDRCITLNAQPNATTFDEAAVASIDLPADATDSLLCFSLTPYGQRTFRNTGAATKRAEFRVALKVTIESSVLQDPSLIDPYTGLPLNGSLPHGLVVSHEAREIAAGTSDYLMPSFTRSCAYGFVHRAQLIDYYGLTPTQADAFFDGPITVTLGLAGTAKLIESVDYRFVIRLYGDRK